MAKEKDQNGRKYWQFFWRSWAIQDSWNYERAMNMGFLYGIAPTLDRIYKDPKDENLKKEAYQRHMLYYNCTPQTSAFVLGLAASMEEQYYEDQEGFNPDTINSVKTSLMVHYLVSGIPSSKEPFVSWPLAWELIWRSKAVF